MASLTRRVIASFSINKYSPWWRSCQVAVVAAWVGMGGVGGLGRRGAWAHGAAWGMGAWAHGRMGAWAHGRRWAWAHGRMGRRGAWAHGSAWGMGAWAHGRRWRPGSAWGMGAWGGVGHGRSWIAPETQVTPHDKKISCITKTQKKARPELVFQTRLWGGRIRLTS